MMPKLYTDLAPWWPLLSPPSDYAEDAAFLLGTLQRHSSHPVTTLLELGSGGGNTASHIKKHVTVTLVDLSEEMLAVSRGLNPECEHVCGDMRTVRLGRRFDAVLIHDAIGYMGTREDLRRAVDTAFAHCRPGGAALFAPDHVRETFSPGTRCGGSDGAGRSLRYLEWEWDPDPDDEQITTSFAYLIREGYQDPIVIGDKHVSGLFPSATWIRTIEEAGFAPRQIACAHHEGNYAGLVFVGRC